MKEFIDKNNRNIVIRRLSENDFAIAYDFYKTEREKLSDKRFFLPYTENELAEILRSGAFFGAFSERRLVGTAALDFDREYGEKLKSIIARSELAPLSLFEFSGVFVADGYRGAGIIEALFFEVTAIAQATLKNACLVSVVEQHNFASVKKMLNAGFLYVATKRLDEIYVFSYFALPINCTSSVPLSKICIDEYKRIIESLNEENAL